MPFLFLVCQADMLAQSTYQREEKAQELRQAQQLYQEIMKSGECVSLKTLAVNGSMLLEDGFQKGKCMGEILKYLLDQVLEHPEDNQKDCLLQLAEKKFPQYRL